MYRQILQADPHEPDALNLLGLLAHQTGRNELAVELLHKAIAAYPDSVMYFNLGLAQQAQGKLDAAQSSYRQALAMKADYFEAYFNLGCVLQAQNQLETAAHNYRCAIALKADCAEAHSGLGNVLNAQGELDAAVECYARALLLKPDFAAVHGNLGTTLQAQGKLEAAMSSYQKALSLTPDNAVLYSNLGNVLQMLDKFDNAIEHYQYALSINPKDAEVCSNMGRAFYEQNKLDMAFNCFQQALLINPNRVETHNLLGNTLKQQGKPDESRQYFERAIELDPGYAIAHNSLLLTLQYSSAIGLQELHDLHLRYGAQFEPELASLRYTHENLRDPGKRLKIGYVSPDLREHAVAYFMEPVLARHDKSRFEVYCYASHGVHDAVSARIQATAEHWIPCLGLSDAQLAQRIHADGIDILIDLAGHTAGNRLLAFARKPAPVQVTFLGYPGTTGLSAMDYRITDVHAEPPGMTEQWNVEQLWRLPEVFCCYGPHPQSPAVIDHPPFEDNGYVTFGCFNNYAKVTDPVIALWARILEQVPTARLMLEIRGLDNAQFKAQVQARFAALGIAGERLLLIPQEKKNQFVLYNRIDIALDPFPCNGGTTSFDTLWMGVPFVTLAGSHFTSRMGVSILRNGGLEQLVAGSAEDYVMIASNLAQDRDELKRLRQNLRARIQASPLMDMARFTTHLEQAYRQMWQLWCEPSGNDLQ